MRVVFMGTPQFAVPSLLALAESTELVGVISRPDAISGRGKARRPSPVKLTAAQLDVPVFQPPTLRDEAALEAVDRLRPDILIVAAYGLILPGAVLQAAPLGAVNVHASLLPRWRGAAPIQRAILAGDRETGVSIMRMETGLDTGPYCLQEAIPVGDADAAELTGSLAVLGARTLVAALPSIADGTAAWSQQDESRVTYAEKITKSDVALSPRLTASDAARRVRASLPAAPTRASIAGRPVTVVAARVQDPDPSPLAPGSLAVTKAGVLLGMRDGSLLVERLKPDGKAEMLATDWARGARDVDGALWDELS